MERGQFCLKCDGKPLDGFKQGSDRIWFNIFKDHHAYSVDNGLEALEKKGGSQEAMLLVGQETTD